jgi:hypothetical protein
MVNNFKLDLTFFTNLKNQNHKYDLKNNLINKS